MNKQFFKPARLDMKAMVMTGFFALAMIYIVGFTDGPIWVRALLTAF